MKCIFSENMNVMFLFQIFEIYNTNVCLTRSEHYIGLYEKNEPYVVRLRYKWTNGIYVSI